MKNNQYLLKSFEELYFLEKRAKDLYDELLLTLTNIEEVKIITKIRDDEMRHMEIAKKIQEIIKNEY